MSTYACKGCGWRGVSPDITEADEVVSVYVSDADGGGFESRVDRRAILVCPDCGFAVRSVDDALTAIINDIATTRVSA